ncbi:MAG: helix-turn-helix domain-containing protein [Flavobacteriaceae bacterium]|nr:helix-turn-helix domain-containing protein [Flavobacteriaceae bacterium]
MDDNIGLKKLFFNLNSSLPIQSIFNRHAQKKESWFDMHYEVEIGIVLKGRMRRYYLNYEMVLDPGDVWFCGIWEPHGFEILEAPCEVMVLVIEPDFIIKNNLFDFDIFKVFQTDPASRPSVKEDNKDSILRIAQKAKNKLQDEANLNWAKSIFFELSLMLLEDWHAPAKVIKSKEIKTGIQPALYLVFNEKKLIRTHEAANECNMSVSTFRIKFKELMHLSFSEFALKYRIKGALSDLQNSKETQEKIALDWGFSDASHLQKHLKKRNI